MVPDPQMRRVVGPPPDRSAVREPGESPGRSRRCEGRCSPAITPLAARPGRRWEGVAPSRRPAALLGLDPRGRRRRSSHVWSFCPRGGPRRLGAGARGPVLAATKPKPAVAARTRYRHGGQREGEIRSGRRASSRSRPRRPRRSSRSARAGRLSPLTTSPTSRSRRPTPRSPGSPPTWRRSRRSGPISWSRIRPEGLVGRPARSASRVILQDASSTLPVAYIQIRQLGAVTGHAKSRAPRRPDDAADPPHRRAAAAGGGGCERVPRADPTFFSASSKTFVGRAYASAGLKNIAAATPGGPYPQLSPEYVVASNPDPTVSRTLCAAVGRPRRWGRAPAGRIEAVRRGSILRIDDSISRRGPRLVNFVRAVGTAAGGSGARRPVG